MGQVFLSQLYAMVIVLAAFLVGPGLAVAFLLMRKRRRRAAGRSPIAKDLLRGAGHSLREQLEEAGSDLSWQILMLAVVPVFAIALYLAQQQAIRAPLGVAPIYTLAVLAFLAFSIRKLLRLGHQLDNLRAGYDAELAVGQELDQLMRQGARVFHDFPAENFNIDHVVISHAGVFAVETKGYTKPGSITGRAGSTVYFDGKVLKFPTWSGMEPLDQADRQAQWLAKWASSAVGETVDVVPVLALPGWWVERTQRGPVRVISGGEATKLLDAGNAKSISAQLVQRIAHRVEQRCRTVVPTYRRGEGNV